jgi:ATPase subunit of ABC transporter with duplicated ATPase domains
MLAKMMLASANVLILDEPTAHLDLESITSLNTGMVDFTEVMIFSSHDHEIVNTVANRIIEFTPSGIIDRQMKFDDYLNSENVKEARDIAYGGSHLRLTI